MKSKITNSQLHTFRSDNEKALTQSGDTQATPVTERLRKLSIEIGAFRLACELHRSERVGLAALQADIASIADKIDTMSKCGLQSQKSSEKICDLAINLINALVESQVYTVSPEIYRSVRNAGVELLQIASPMEVAA